jgi:hypothetical protein
MSKESDGLVGMFFNGVLKGGFESGEIIANPEPGWYMVKTMFYLEDEWNDGWGYHLVRIEDMATWLFYEDTEALLECLKDGAAFDLKQKTLYQ